VDDCNLTGDNDTINGQNDVNIIDQLWHIHQRHMFDRYFANMFDQIVATISDDLSTSLHDDISIAWVMFVLGALIEIFLIQSLMASEEHQKFAFRLLLQCPGNVVVSNAHITALLAGHFHEKSMDSTTRDTQFYDVIVADLPDAVVIINQNRQIVMANRATGRVYGIPPQSVIGHQVSVLGAGFRGENIFAANQLEASEKVVAYVNSQGAESHLEVSVSTVHENTIIMTRDVTQTVMYNRLIADERAKSDQLLSSILPARLVARVQAGEKNISFAVQSATIVFMDIVSFTPWCGSLPAATVMKTLNLLFKEFDALVAVHGTMTKIKCIGDCYMAAGGIFMDVNQPGQHAKDVVEFGLDAITALEILDKRIDQKLEIRVGINTGGPIVAGVLGTAKPTFEIIGPAINMAQQMEHHGVAMHVHISRAVYELIYGGSFAVKERGEVQLKNGPAVTYLIEKRPLEEDGFK
jgi:PAS domain S-box-containing protein